jgi:hypothetical protein
LQWWYSKVCENGLSKPYIIYERSFYQDRLGTNMGETSKKTTVFSQATPSDSFVLGPSGYGAKNATFGAIHSYIKCTILPRQARDKHRENTQKE